MACFIFWRSMVRQSIMKSSVRDESWNIEIRVMDSWVKYSMSMPRTGSAERVVRSWSYYGVRMKCRGLLSIYFQNF